MVSRPEGDAQQWLHRRQRDVVAYHNYQAELYPTRIRSRAVGFVYSWSRIAAAFAGLAIGYLLHAGGALAVALFIAIAMVIGIAMIGIFGPQTKGATLEEISH